MMNDSLRWYAVQTKPRAEDQAIGWVQRRATIPVFLPRLEVWRRRRGEILRHIEPLFPSYFFAYLGSNPREWDAVKWASGVRRIVSIGETPAPIPDDAIRFLSARCTDGVVRWRPQLAPGTELRITAGPFAGLAGILERPTSRPERVRVLLRLMRTPVPVEVDIVDVEPAAAGV